ncbi:hypothetical protein D3C72_1874890 [compost metagenome]
MLDPGGLFRSGEVTSGCLEEIQHGGVFERRRVRHVDDDIGTFERLLQAFAGDGIDAGIRRGRKDVMAPLTQVVAELGSDQAGSANDYDLHICASLWVGAAGDFWRLGKSTRPGKPGAPG